MNTILLFDSIIKAEGKNPEDWTSLLNELKGNKEK